MTTQRRPDSCNLLSESITADCSRITAYERLSDSMRLEPAVNSACFGPVTDSKKKALYFLGKIFGIGRNSGSASASGSASDDDDKSSQADGVAAPPEKERKRSSWLPDPDRRWPVQGW